MPERGVGGSGSPFTDVTSVPCLPPRGPRSGYCPLTGAGCPGLNFGLLIGSHLLPATRRLATWDATPERIFELPHGRQREVAQGKSSHADNRCISCVRCQT